MKTIDPYEASDNTFTAACDALDVNNYIQLEKCFDLPDPRHNIERELIKKDTFFSLSVDAINLVQNILDGSNAEMLTPTGIATKRTIVNFLLHKEKWKQRRIKKVFREINQFVETF